MNNEDLLNSITDQVPGLIVVYNINTGEYVYVNNAVKKILGYQPEDFLNGGIKFVTSLVHPDDLPSVMAENKKALDESNRLPLTKLDEEPIISFSYRMKHKNGTYRWLHSEGRVLRRTNEGNVELVLNISIDTTNDKETELQMSLTQSELESLIVEHTTTLQLTQKRATAVLDSVGDAIITTDLKFNILSWNKAAEELYGWMEPEVLEKGVWELIQPGIAEETQKKLVAHIFREGEWKGEIVQKNKQGQRLHVLATTSLIKDSNENPVGIVSINRDITGRKKYEDALKQSEEHFRTLVKSIEDYAIFRLDPEGNITSWNEGIKNILGYLEDEIVGKPVDVFFTSRDRERNLLAYELGQARLNGTFIADGLRVRKDGTTFYATITVTAIYDELGQLKGYSKIIRDITALKEAEETIRFQAFHDILTGLANRQALDDSFSLYLSMAVRHKHKLAILFLDLDRFKTINDTLGHGIGDMILREVAHRLSESVRKEDIVARLGGDEFIILLNEIHSVQDVVKVAEKILKAFTTVMRVQNQSLHVSTSIGIAMFPADGQDIYTLLKNADTALYRAKDAGRSRYQFYNYSMNLQSVARLSLEQDLRSAVVNQELKLVYQPFINIANKKVIGAEALVRWHHPRLGVLLPYDFIPLAEETGMIVSIGRWILESICTQGKLFHDQKFALQMAVNLSARQFAESDLVDTITTIINETGFEPEALELEITESVAMENIHRTNSKLQELKEKGMSVSIDDFGTGYSSLSYLKRFPVHKLKIDKSFVKHAITDPQDSAIIHAIISMAHSLGLKVCAEGVEEEQQLSLLESMKCDMAQGYLLSKPLSAEQLSEWLANYEN